MAILVTGDPSGWRPEHPDLLARRAKWSGAALRRLSPVASGDTSGSAEVPSLSRRAIGRVACCPAGRCPGRWLARVRPHDVLPGGGDGRAAEMQLFALMG